MDKYKFSFPFPIGVKSDGDMDFTLLNLDIKTNSNESMFELSMKMLDQSLEASISVEDNMYNVSMTMNTRKDVNIHETYDEDLNILQIHQKIINILSNGSEDKIYKLNKLLHDAEDKIKLPQNYRDRMDTVKIINKIQEDIKNITYNTKYNNYIEETNKLINQ